MICRLPADFKESVDFKGHHPTPADRPADLYTIVCRLMSPHIRLASFSEPWHDKTNKMSVRPAKTQISLGIRLVWSVFAVCTKKAWVLSYPLSAQQRLWSCGWMPRLIWVFAGRTVTLLVLSCHGSSHLWSVAATPDVIKSRPIMLGHRCRTHPTGSAGNPRYVT